MPKNRSPQILYKYYGSDRIEVFENFLVRFSQPKALNDPFELSIKANPNTLAKGAEKLAKEVANPFAFVRMAIGSAIQQTTQHERIKALPWLLRLAISTIIIVAAPILALLVLPFARKHLVRILSAAGSDLQKMLHEKGAGIVLVFSCSALWQSVPLWAHYAGNHTGFVIGFDPETAFKATTKKGPTFLKPRAVKYIKQAPKISLSKGKSGDLFCSKFEDWRYEREWRFIGLSDDAAQRGRFHAGQEVLLFPLDSASIREVVFGLQTPDCVIQTVKDCLEKAGISPVLYRVGLTEDYGFSRSLNLQSTLNATSDAAVPSLADIFPENAYSAFLDFKEDARSHPVLKDFDI